MVDSGKYEMKPGTQRTYNDMKNEIATNLANLPRFTARVKTEDGEFVVKMPLPQKGLEGRYLTQRIERIRNNTRRLYCRPRKEVEAEIAARQRTDPPPPTTKRVHEI